ncbi:MAG: hypothetical protein ACLQNE_04105 [Thermoguttaceae bacterium]
MVRRSMIEKNRPTDSFSEQALRAIAAAGAATEPPFSRGSRRDFVRAVQLLQPDCGDGNPRLESTPRTRRVHVSCSYKSWVRVFGELEDVEAAGTTPTRTSLYVWKHRCTDGVVTCVGHLLERSPGVKWMVIVRLALSSERFLNQETEVQEVSSAGPLRTMGVACQFLTST